MRSPPAVPQTVGILNPRDCLDRAGHAAGTTPTGFGGATPSTVGGTRGHSGTGRRISAPPATSLFRTVGRSGRRPTGGAYTKRMPPRLGIGGWGLGVGVNTQACGFRGARYIYMTIRRGTRRMRVRRGDLGESRKRSVQVRR